MAAILKIKMAAIICIQKNVNIGFPIQSIVKITEMHISTNLQKI